MRYIVALSFFIVLFGGCADKTVKTSTDIKETKSDYSTFDYGIFISSPKMLCRDYTKVKQNPINIKGYVNSGSKSIAIINKTTNKSYQGQITKQGDYILENISLAKGSNNLEFILTKQDNKQTQKEIKVFYDTLSIQKLISNKKASREDQINALTMISKIPTKVLNEVLQNKSNLYKKRLIEEFEKEPSVKKVLYAPECVGSRAITIIFKSGIVERVNAYIPAYLLHPSKIK